MAARSIRRTPAALLISAFLLVPHAARAQHPNVRVSSASANQPEEVSIAVNPLDPRDLAAASNIRYGFTNLDAGPTWSESILTSSLGTAGDPVVLYDAEGNLYYAHLSHVPGGPYYDRIVVQRSTDGGLSWNDGAGIGLNDSKMQDKPGLAADQTESPYHGNLYLAWTEFDTYGSSDPADSSRILFSRSSDRGANWSAPYRVSEAGGDAMDDDNTVEGAIPAVGPEGQVYLAWSGPGGIRFDRSPDGGATFGSDVFVTNQPGGWAFDVSGIFRCNGLPTTLCDISHSPYRGRVYVVWSDQRAGGTNTDVFVAHSSDGGSTWAPSVLVNDDATARHQFFPAAALDPTSGILYVSYYDRRATIDDATEVYLSRSEDGGQTFHSVQISDVPFTPDPNVFFGDYIGLAAWNQRVYPIWMRMDGTTLSVWTASLSDTQSVLAISTPARRGVFQLGAARPNPLRSTTWLSYTLARAGPVSVRIVDVSGRQVALLANGVQEAGEHQVEWNARDHSPGLYFCAVSANGETRAGRLIVVH